MKFLQQAMEMVILEAIKKEYDQEKITRFMKTEIFENEVRLVAEKLTELSKS